MICVSLLVSPRVEGRKKETRSTLLEKQRWTHKRCTLMDPHTWPRKSRMTSSYVRIQDVVLKTYLGRWTIGRSGERGSGISVLPARYDDDDGYPTLGIKANLNNPVGQSWFFFWFPILPIRLPNFLVLFQVHQQQSVLPSPSCSTPFLVLEQGLRIS